MRIDRDVHVTVVIAGTDVHHDLYGAAGALRDALAEGGMPTQIAVGMERYAQSMPVTEETDVFVLYTSGSALPPEEQEALREHVRRGKGVVALHASNVVLTADQNTFTALVGSAFVSHAPGGLSEGLVRVRLADHPITAYMGDFTLQDEYYVTETASDAVVIAEHQLPDGNWAPALITREEGAGRVVYSTLGHDGRAWADPGFRQLLRQSVLWTARAEPTTTVRSWSTRFPLGNGCHQGPDGDSSPRSRAMNAHRSDGEVPA